MKFKLFYLMMFLIKDNCYGVKHIQYFNLVFFLKKKSLIKFQFSIVYTNLFNIALVNGNIEIIKMILMHPSFDINKKTILIFFLKYNL